MQPSIRILPEYLIDQIKAGEVIEGPTSLIKELVENSIDAKSTQLKIQIENNGLNLISIEDNGVGITLNDLPLAFSRHTTSKIEKFEDLYHLATFGFRGEALASIASISRVTAFSRPVEGEGGKIVFHGSKIISHLPVEGLDQGTSIFVRDLFYNTPVRFKFIKSKNSERNSLVRIINSFIISNPSIYFSVKWEDRDKLIFKPSTSHERILQVLPKGDYQKIKGEYQGHQLEGLIDLRSSKGGSKNHQFLFANNRLFLDKALHSAISNAMEGYWNPGESGNYCFFLKTHPENIDVNVHPRKMEIKFTQSSLVFSLFQSSIRNSIQDFPKNKNTKTLGLSNFLEKNSHISDLPNETSIEPFFKLNENFVLYPFGGNYFILNIPVLTREYFKTKFQKIEENSQIPLLIAEPYNLSNENIIEFLKPFGFNFEKITEMQMVLLTIPSYLSELPFRKMIEEFLNFLNKNEVLNFENLDFSNLKLSFSQIKFLVKPFDNSLPKQPFARLLDSQLLKSLFYE